MNLQPVLKREVPATSVSHEVQALAWIIGGACAGLVASVVVIFGCDMFICDMFAKPIDQDAGRIYRQMHGNTTSIPPLVFTPVYMPPPALEAAPVCRFEDSDVQAVLHEMERQGRVDRSEVCKVTCHRDGDHVEMNFRMKDHGSPWSQYGMPTLPPAGL